MLRRRTGGGIGTATSGSGGGSNGNTASKSDAAKSSTGQTPVSRAERSNADAPPTPSRAPGYSASARITSTAPAKANRPVAYAALVSSEPAAVPIPGARDRGSSGGGHGVPQRKPDGGGNGGGGGGTTAIPGTTSDSEDDAQDEAFSADAWNYLFGFGVFGLSFVPGVGEAMDIAVFFDPESEWWEIGLSGFSLGINWLTGGFAPNVGGVLHARKGLLTKARRARDRLVDQTQPLKGKAPATVTGGYNLKTGEAAARACGGGKCAEDHVVDALGGVKENVRFTKAVRPRTRAEVPVCARCEASYGRGSFPAGTRFKSDE